MPDRQTTRAFLDSLRANWPAVAAPESEIVMALIRLNSLARRGMDHVLDAHSLTPAGFEVLVTLRSMPPPRQLTPTDLYRFNLLSSGGLTKILNHLSGRSLIELLPNPADRRSKIVKLTRKGKRLVERAASDVTEQDHELFADRLSTVQTENLRSVLLEALDVLEAAEPTAAHKFRSGRFTPA